MALNFYQYTKSADKYGPIATPEPVKAKEPGLLGNMGRSAGSGALSAVGGIFDFVGADGIAKQFYGWSDDARQSMSAEAQADMAKPFFSENDQGEIQLGEGLTDLDAWLLTLANVAGQLAPTMIPGAGIGSAATKALKLGESGAKWATRVGMGATGGAAATGQGMEQAREEWMQMPDELKIQSDLFKNTIREMKQQKPELDGEALWTAAENNVAERLASEVQTDQKVLLANFAGSAIADPIIGRALTGARLAKSGAFRSAAKGFAIEGSTEAGQTAVQEYSINQALSQVDGRDPMDGVAVAALNEGVAGGTLGGAAGAFGGVWNRQAEPVKDPDADAIRESNPVLALGFDGIAQDKAMRDADLANVMGEMNTANQPALEGELLGPDDPASPNYNPNQIGMQARIGGPTVPRITQKDVIFAADGRTEAERNPAMEGEWLSPEQRAANAAAGFIENAPIDLESEQVKQAKADMERMRNQPRQITDKNVIFAGDGRPQQAAQEYVDNLQRQANQAASVPRLPQKDIIFAGDQSGVRVKGNGEVYKSPREAVTSKQARAMKRSGTPVEAVQFGDGWGWRVKEVQPEQQANQVDDTDVVESNSDQAAERTDGSTSTVDEKGLTLLHGSPKSDIKIDDVQIIREGQWQKQGKKGRVYGGFYTTSEADIEYARGYAEMGEGSPTIHNVKIKPGTKVLQKNGNITRLSETYIDELKSQGYGLVVGKDPRGKIEYVVIDKNVIADIKARETDTAPQTAQGVQARPAIQGRATGKQSVATTPAGRDIDVEYQVVEADSLVTSNLEDGRSNPDFPPELQPRDRSRAASQDQINRIAGAVNPRLLAESATTSDGAPIISADGIVESGNGRSLGLRKAYRQGGAEGYRQFLTDSGFDIDGMKQPVLVRVRRTELSPEDRLAYIKESNQRTTLEMSATEQAASDAAKMAGVVADYQGGEITSAENRSFVRKFMQNVAGEAERGGLMDSSGVLSQNGRRRIEAALLSAAYGDDGIVAEVFESGDTDIKAIGGALLDAAGKWAQMRNAQRDGMIADGMDVTPFLLEAVNLIRRARGQVNDFLVRPEKADTKETNPEYPYPAGVERQNFNAAFNKLIEVIETKETDKGVMLFSKQNTIKAKPAKGVNAKLAKQFVNGIMQRLNGAAGIKVVVLETQAEAEKLWQMSLAGDLVRGAYNRATNTAYVIAENIKSMDELREVVAHEVIGHGGLQNVISKADYKTFIERLKQTRDNRAFADQWTQIDKDYKGFSENDKAEELFAYFVQNKPVTGPVKFWWNALKRWLHKALVSVGLAKAGDPDIEAMQDMLESIRAGFMLNRGGGLDPTDPDLRFSKTRTAEAVAGAVTDFVGRKRLDPNDPYAVENRRLKEQDRTLWDKAKQVFMRNFAPGGMLPRSIFDAKITRDGELESGEMTIKHLIFALERAVQNDTGKNVDNQSDEFINMMADALAGKVNDKLGNETKAALVAMRQYIDALSGDYLSVIQAKIDELTEQIKQDDKYTDKVRALNEIELYEKIKGNMGVYVNRSYRAFDDPKWFQKVPVDVINRAREYLRKQYKSQGDDQAEANRKAEVTLNKILKTDTAYDSMASFIAESKLGAKDLSTLIARKDISPEIRELLGEYKDPRMNFAKTATKMARLVWNSRFLDKVKADGVGVFFFDEDSRPAEATVQIAGDNSKAYEPLNGYWTFPEVAEALQDSLGTEKMEAWYEAAVKLTSMVKYGKTVLSPTTAMRNWQSAMFFAVANGHFDFKHMKKSLAAFREQVSQSASGDDLAYLKKLKKLGVVYDAPYAGEMMQLLSDSKIDEWLEGRKGKVFGTARQINNLAQGFYSFGDDFWKIIGFENEKANFISAGLSEAEAEKMAAERIRNTYPTYSMVGRAIKKLARFPLMGTFVSFPAEIIRTTANMLRYAAQDMKSDNPKIRAMARKRLTGMALVSGMFYALSAMTAAMLGVDDEEEEAIRDVGPSWQKNSTFLFYGRDDKGKLQYFDISFLDPYGYFKRPITALMRDQPWEDAAASGAADMLSPFFGADITAGTFFQVFANKKQSGGQVYNEYADGTDQLVSIADHIWTGLRPGFVNNAMGIFNAAVGNRREGSGKEYDLGDEMMALMGWRASSLDAPTALYYRSFDFADQLQAANSTLNKVLRSDNSVDDDDIADAKEEAQRQYDDAFKQMQRIVQSGRNAGMTKEQVYRTLKLSGVSSRNISGLVNGNIPPMQAATLQTQVKAVAKAREIRGDEQASEVLRRFQIARQLQ